MAKDKNKKPFNVLSKKGLMTLALAGVMAVSPFMLVGCGEAGPAGKDGATGATGATGAAGKSAYELAVENGFEGTLQDWLDSLKGDAGNSVVSVTKTATNGLVDTYTITFTDGSTTTFDITNGAPGATGPEGPQGSVGENGSSVYVGYDGYIWNGAERTEFKATNVTIDDYVVENTIGIEGAMSEYFEGSYIDLSSNTIALMANYMPNAKLTQYSGTTITELKVYAEEDGNLYIGTAKVADIVGARTNGTTYTSTTTPYEVKAGLNTITLNLDVAEDETIVLGGQGSVGLYHAQGITIDDEHGNYTLVDGTAHTEIISETSDIQDTLAIQVSAQIGSLFSIDLSTAESAIAEASSETDEVTSYGISNPNSAPWMFSNSKDAFANKALVSIRIPVVSVDSITENPIFTIRIAKYNKSGTLITEENVRETINLQIPLSEVANGVLDTTSAAGNQSTLGEYVVNKWITLDLTQYKLFVNEGETIVFGDTNDTTRLAYYTTAVSSLNFISLKGVPSTGNVANSFSYLADVTVADYTAVEIPTLEQHLQNLLSKEEVAKEANKLAELKAVLNGKQFSLLGDSISTYNGYCNDTDANSTLENNVFRYDDEDQATGSTVPFTSVNETWWMQTANTTTMDLLVNNSWAGSEVFGERTGTNGVHIDGAWENRCVQLHDDNGEKQGTNPDVIAVYLGINDYNFNRSNVGSGEIDFDALITDNEDGTFTYATPTKFKDAYAIMIHKMLTKYDNAQIFIFTVLPEDMYSIDQTSWNLHNKYIRDVANHFNLPIVDLANDSGITWTNMHDYLHTDKIHPNEAGMDLITECFINALLDHYVPAE